MGALHAFLFDAVGGDEVEYRLHLHRVGEPDGSDAATHVARDAEVVARIRDGDTEAFEAMYRANAVSLAAFANGIVRAPDIAEELVGDVFVRLWDTRNTFAPAAGVRAYLYTAVRHRALNHVRAAFREGVRHRTFVADVSPASHEEVGSLDGAGQEERQKELVAAVQRIVDTFPPARRQVMELRWNDGLTNAEISVVLGLTDQAVRSHLSRALRDLRVAFPDLIG